MRVVEFLSEGRVIANLSAGDKAAAITEIANVLAQGSDAPSSVLLEALWAREKTGSTAIGEGVAIPHGRVSALPGIVGCFARSTPGVPFDARDGKPSHLFFALLAPEACAAQYLKALACVAALFKNASLRTKLMEAGSADEIYRLLTADS